MLIDEFLGSEVREATEKSVLEVVKKFELLLRSFKRVEFLKKSANLFLEKIEGFRLERGDGLEKVVSVFAYLGIFEYDDATKYLVSHIDSQIGLASINLVLDKLE